nr:hypothetical protein [Tanacetum cinerariifolium]
MRFAYRRQSCVLPREDSASFKTWLLLCQDFVAFCLEDLLRFVSRPLPFVSRLSCVLSQDLLRFVFKLTAFCLQSVAFYLQDSCVLSTFKDLFLSFENRVNILKSIDEGPYKIGTVRETLAESTEGAPRFGPERPRVCSDMSPEEKDRYLRQCEDAPRKHKGESIHDYYVRFAKLINDMRNIKMTMSRMQLNSKFMNNMLPEWGRFMTAVKLNRGLRDSKYDQLYAYLKQHETHAKENKMMLERFSLNTVDPLALMSNVSTPQRYSPSSSTQVPQPLSDNPHLNSSLSLVENLIKNLTNTLALLTQSYKTFLPQTNNQLRTSSNARNQATVQDVRVVVQNVQGRQNRGQGMNQRGGSAAGYGGAQNRIGNVNPGQARPVKCYNCNEQLLFLAGGQDNAFDDDVDEQPVQDLALNDAVCTHHKEHVMHDSVQLDHVVDSHADYTSDSNMIPYDQYVKDNEVQVVHSNVSSVPNDAFMMIYNDMCEPHAQSVSNLSQNTVAKNSLTAELATYKEQVELYERRAKFELTEREQKINEQLRLIISNRNFKEETLKKELYSIKLQLASTINHNESMVEEVTFLKKDFKQKENKYLEDFLDMKSLKEKPALYNGHEIIKDNHAPAIVHNTEDTLEIAEITRKKINAKMNDPECETRKVKIAPHDYSKENFLTTFTPQKQPTPEQIFWYNDLIKLKSEALKEQTTKKPPQDFDIRQLVREECCIEVCEEQKQNMENTMLELVEVCRQKEFYCMHDNVDDLIESALNSKLLSINLNSQRLDKEKQEVKNVMEQPAEHRTQEPEYSISMGYEHLNTTPEMESDEIIKYGVEELVPIPNECEVTSEDKRECDVLICEDSSTFDVCDNHSEILSDFNDDDISSDDDAFEDIEYVEASLLDPEIVSLEEENDVYQEEEEVDLEDIFQIQDIVLREKLLNINRLIANIDSLNDNPTLDRMLNSFDSIPIFEESDNSLSDNSLPEFETFSDQMKETRSGSTTTHAHDSLPEYDSFCFEIEPDQERLTSIFMNDIYDDSTNDPLLEEVDLFLASDNSIPPGIENFSYNSEGDIHFLEELLIDDSIPFPNNESFDFEDDSLFPRPPPELPDVVFSLIRSPT